MRMMIAALILPVAAFAQDFGPVPLFTKDGSSTGAVELHACIADQAALGPDAIVSPSARDCIGLMAASCTADAVTCAALEQLYWEWRIGQNALGLVAWVSDQPDLAALDDLRAMVANPAMLTANVPLECDLRIRLKDQAATAAEDKAQCIMREVGLIALELEFTVRQACDDPGTGAFATFCGKGGQ